MAMRLSKPPVLQRGPRQPVEGLFCSYSHRVCMQNRLDGYEYCIKHILEDKIAPYKHCSYMSNKTGKRCPNAVLKVDKREGFCLEHSRKIALMRQRANQKRRPKETPETLLEELDHYIPKVNEHGQEVKGRTVDSLTHNILDYASSSDSDGDPSVVDQAWRGDGDSDAESVDSEQEDPLKHSGIYTAEEVALITRDKLIRLQSLYIDQFKRLQHVMKEKKRRYLHTVRLERETLGSIHDAKEDPEQRDQYDKLMAMKRYHRRHGKEALLHRQSKERRILVSEGTNYKPPSYPKCVHLSKGIKCGGRTVPLSKFCYDHIQHDQHQILFQQCQYGNGPCPRLVMGVSDINTCSVHTQLDDFEYHMMGKKDNQEEEEEVKEESIDVVGGSEVAMLDGQSEYSPQVEPPAGLPRQPPEQPQDEQPITEPGSNQVIESSAPEETEMEIDVEKDKNVPVPEGNGGMGTSESTGTG